MTFVSTRPVRRFSWFLLCALCLNLVTSSLAAAETDRERARQHVVDGDALKVAAEKAKADGDADEAAALFQESADEYQAAYDLVPHPLMLYNLAQVYRLAGDEERALALYKEFLASNPTGEAAEFARKYVKILERAIARAKERKGNEQDRQLGDDDDDAGDDDDDAGDDDDDDTFGDDDLDDQGTPGAGASDTMRYGGLGLAGAGLISIAVGVKFGLDARNISNCLTNYPLSCEKAYPAGSWTDESLALQAEGKSAEQKMFILTGLGAALIVGGGVLYYVGGHKSAGADGRSAVRLAPSVSAHSAGWAVSGQF